MYNIYKNHFSWYFLAYGQVSNLRWKTKKLLTVQAFHVGDDHGRMDQKDRNTMATINVVPSHNSAICGWILKILVAIYVALTYRIR